MTIEPWQEPLRQALQTTTGGTLFLLTPDYRPDLLKQLALSFEFAFCDVRAEVLAARGLQAGSVAAEDVNAYIEQRLSEHNKGILLHNTEAWLATQSAAERQAWLAERLAKSPEQYLIIPVMVYNDELPNAPARIVALNAELFPEASLVSWFAH